MLKRGLEEGRHALHVRGKIEHSSRLSGAQLAVDGNAAGNAAERRQHQLIGAADAKFRQLRHLTGINAPEILGIRVEGHVNPVLLRVWV